jgi:methylthioribose-1-phosphate isomerase
LLTNCAAQIENWGNFIVIIRMSAAKQFEINELSIRYKNCVLSVLDQTKLPDTELWITVTTLEEMFNLIKQLSVRGAPLIAVAAALALLVRATQGTQESLIMI